jgi:putative PIN family toxin of toxin-antitoxin system
VKAVYDTNVFVSAFVVPGSKGEQAFLLAHRHQVALYSSVPILTETAGILRRKFNQPEKDVRAALKMMGRSAIIVRPSRKVTVLKDLPDNRILECALAAQAEVIVSGDRHLLGLKQFEGVPILRLADFLRLFPSN